MEKIVLLSGFTEKEVEDLIDNYKSEKKLPAAIIAVATEVTMGMRLKDVVESLSGSVAKR